MLGRNATVYRKERSFDGSTCLAEKYLKIYKKKDNKEEREYYIDKELNIALQVFQKTYGIVTHK